MDDYKQIVHGVKLALGPLRIDDLVVAVQFFQECGSVLIQVPKKYQVPMVRRAITLILGEADRYTEQSLYYHREHIKIISLERGDPDYYTQGYSRVFYVGYNNGLDVEEYRKQHGPVLTQPELPDHLL